MRRLFLLILALPVRGPAQARTMVVRTDSVVAPQAQFAMITQLIALDSTRAIVLDGKAFEISLVTVGAPGPVLLSHQGEGPGEFRAASRIGSIGDSAWAIAQGRFAVLSLNGRGGVTVDPGARTVAVLPGQAVTPRALLTNRTFLVLKRYPPDMQAEPGKRRTTVLLGSASTSSWAEVATLDAIGPFNIDLANPSLGDATAIRSESYLNTFRTADEIVSRPNGNGFAIVRQHATPPDAATSVVVEVYDVAGRRTSTGTVSLPPVPGGAQIALAMRAQLQHRMEQSRLARSPSVVAAAILAQIGASNDVPAATAEFLSAANTLWLRRIGTDDQPRHWVRIDLRANRAADVVFSPGCAPADEIEGRLWLTCTENDVPVVRRGWVH